MSSRATLDTNVLVIANLQNADVQESCVYAAREWVAKIAASGVIYLDTEDAVLDEYGNQIDAEARPQDISARLLIWLRQSRFSDPRIHRVDLQLTDEGEYKDCPEALIRAGFDPSDRKFVALARKGKAKVVNATDTDWLIHAELLQALGVKVDNICGCNPADIFKP